MDTFKISYVGGVADDHVLDMRRLGYALVGLDHLLSAGLIGMMEFRFPKSRERVDITLVAQPPREGSVEIIGSVMAAYQALQTTFPFLQELIKSKSPDLIWHWLNFSFKWLGGRKSDAEPHLDKCLEFMRDIHSQTMQDRRDERGFLIELLESQRQNTARVAMPIGNDSRALRIGDGDAQTYSEIDIPMAAAIRSKDELNISDLLEIDLRIDGITKHSDRATVEFLSDPEKYHYAEIRDPAIHAPDNVYFRALASSQPIRVIARLSYKGDDVHRVYVLVAKDENDPLPHVA